ncbi:hypothetical protein [Paenibacillus puerhi]|uniref:hypothetical protein n=1 Tax=Paenibacillus puerhi TaxID=2692622 RepID=UPI0013598709|nr:hypothetical protein [Paenibacillus puerhi]
MPNWIEAIRGCGLTFVGKHMFGESYELYETLHSWQGIKLGKYLIIPAPLELFDAISESADSFRRFEDEVISPYYFRLKGDWSWNLYIVFVVPDMTCITADRLTLIQRGKRFGKKSVISFDQLADKLPMAKIPDSLGGSAAGNPLQDWQQQLASEGLLFCLEDFRSQPVKSYVEMGARSGHAPIEPAAASTPVVRPVGPLAALDFGNAFRPHVLANVPPLQFTQVNLLAGPNGMGKTSVLESIELAFTGSIQRNLLADRHAEESWNGRVFFQADGEAPFLGTPQQEEKRQRETAYYRHKVSPRAHSQLNSAFHQYNYFSSEAVHQFCFGSAGKVDYRAAFARVIFGEQLERYEQCWRQHVEEFRKLGRKLNEDCQELAADLQSKFSEGVQDSELLKGRAHAQLQQVSKWMRQSMFSYPVPEEGSSLTEIEQWLHHMKPLLHELDIASEPFARQEPPDISTIQQLNEQEQAGKASLSGLQAQFAELKRQLEKLPSSSEWEETVRLRWNEFSRLRGEQDAFLRLSERLKELSYLIDQRDSRLARERIEERILSLESALSLLSDVDNLYGHLTAHPLTDTDITGLRARLRALETSRALTQEALNQASEQAEKLKEQTGRLQKLLAELKATARLALQLQPNPSHCPLCGHDHETTQVLTQAIDSSLQANDNELTERLTEIEQDKIKLEAIDSEYRRLRHALKLLEQLAEAREYLLDRRDIEEASALDSGSGLQAVQHVLIRIRERIDSHTRSLIDMRRQAQALDERGITISSIRELKELLGDALLAPYLPLEDSELTGALQLSALFKQGLDDLLEKVEMARLDYAAVQDRARQTEVQRQALTDQIESLSTQEQQLKLRLHRIGECRRACSRLEELNVRLPDHQSWNEWRLTFQKLMLAAEELEQALEPLVLVERKAQEVAELMNRLEVANVKKERCDRAVRVLSELRSLTDYGDDFVRSNFEAISRLFVALHAPNEFEGLEWTADNRIEAKRRGSGAPCALYQMSTGQRTSVLLAIFFIMHLVMESAPQFLLLDEPVANLDELNVLGLLDFLRQLTITRGTQLFFTTANPQIATLFRRKFSFLEDRFRVFHLRRDVEGPVSVHIQHFKPYQEKPVALTH